MDKLLIGRKDKADLPEFGLNDIDIKIDTGAYTSSIHCHHIEELGSDEDKYVRFELLDPDHPDYHNKPFICRDYEVKRVKSSNGEVQNRYIIKTVILLFGRRYRIRLSLSDRSSMNYPVLIGRRLLNGRFIVDTTLKDISYNEKIKKETEE